MITAVSAQVESESVSFMVHAAHAGAEFPDDFDQQAMEHHEVLQLSCTNNASNVANHKQIIYIYICFHYTCIYKIKLIHRIAKFRT